MCYFRMEELSENSDFVEDKEYDEVDSDDEFVEIEEDFEENNNFVSE